MRLTPLQTGWHVMVPATLPEIVTFGPKGLSIGSSRLSLLKIWSATLRR
jgi:ABC-type nitrate/sulfonate/bicarbonate transport system permease component